MLNHMRPPVVLRAPARVCMCKILVHLSHLYLAYPNYLSNIELEMRESVRDAMYRVYLAPHLIHCISALLTILKTRAKLSL